MNAPKSGRRRLVVIGNGMAGARAVEDVLARGGADTFDIAMFGDEPHGNYNRIMLSGVLSGGRRLADIVMNPLDWYVANGIRLQAGDRVTAIDRAARTVTAASGLVEPYDVLLIATGSRAFLPPIPGLQRASGRLIEGAHAFRTIEDCQRIIDSASRRGHAVVIGGGLLGLEAARGLREHGCTVDVIHRAPHLMNAQLDAAGGAMLKRAIEQMGIAVHVDAATKMITGTDRVTGICLADGRDFAADMLIVSAGITPNAELGRDAGLPVNRAILVDDALRTEDPSIYAVGECAEHRGVVYGLVAPVWQQARVFADQVTGRDPASLYQGSRLSTKLKVMGVELASMGLTEPERDDDEVIQFTEHRHRIYKKLIVRDGRLLGGILMGDISKAAYLMQAYDRDALLPDERVSLLFDVGEGAPAVPLTELPDSAQICNCNAVPKGTIRATVAAGTRDATAVMTATRAGLGCGSCRSKVIELVTHFAAALPAEPAAAPLDTAARLSRWTARSYTAAPAASPGSDGRPPFAPPPSDATPSPSPAA